MRLGERVFYVLSHNAAVVALAGTRITPSVMPQGQLLPAIVYTVVTSEAVATVDGPSWLRHSIVQIDCYSNEYDVAHNVADKIDDALSGYDVPADVSFVHEGSRDLQDEGVTQYHRVMMQFSIWGGDR